MLTLIPMFWHRLLKLLSISIEMKRPAPDWPHRIVRDTAYLFIPFAFATFLLLLGGALLITWGKLPSSVLVGFCVTGGILVGFFGICHFALYCASAEGKVCGLKKDRNSSENGSSVFARPVKLSSPLVCTACLGGISSMRVPAVATFPPLRFNAETQARVADAPEEVESGIPPPADPNPQQSQSQADTRDALDHGSFAPITHLSATVAPLNVPGLSRGNGILSGANASQNPASSQPERGVGNPVITAPHHLAQQVQRPGISSSTTAPAMPHIASLRNINPPSGDSVPPVATRHPARTMSPSKQHKAPETRPQIQHQATLGSQRTGPPARLRPQSPHSPALPALLRSPEQHATTLLQRSPNRQTQYPGSRYPFSPREVGSPSTSRGPLWGPRPQHPRRNVPSHENEQPVPATREGAHAVPADYGSPQQQQTPTRTYEPYRRPEHFRSEETHMLVFQEADLFDLISRGVIKVNPESQPPEWMMLERKKKHEDYAPLGHFLSKTGLGDVGMLAPFATRGVGKRTFAEHCGAAEEATEHHSRCVETGCIRAAAGSVDSGYCSASSLAPLSAVSTLMSGKSKQAAHLLGLGICAASLDADDDDGRRRALRRRSSVPELGRRFHGVRDDELLDETKDEGDGRLSKLSDYLWDEMHSSGFFSGNVARRSKTGGRSESDRRSESSSRDG